MKDERVAGSKDGEGEKYNQENWGKGGKPPLRLTWKE
jgi:hypothetical protein